MRRQEIAPRPNWRDRAEMIGFRHAEIGGIPYWDESAFFEFRLDEIELSIEEPTRELHEMCLDFAEAAVRDQALLTRLGIPLERHDDVAASWAARDTEWSLYGRFDLAYDGQGPAKLLEYNADTPTALFESAVFQWTWLEEQRARGAIPFDTDQFNSLHEALIARFATFPHNALFHFAGYLDDVEDGGVIDYLADCATQAGQQIRRIDVERIGADAQGRFTDEDDVVITRMFKLYPWEWVFASDYAPLLRGSGCQFVEPLWKAMLSTKALLPLLWERHSGHPNLLPAYFDDDPRAGTLAAHVRKPLFSREGANVSLVTPDGGFSVDGPYGSEGFIVQQATPLFRSSFGHAVLGSWIVGDTPCGLCLREDASPITRNTSRFLPHVILDNGLS
jgi:glutathionylspermidine synthase